MEYCTLLVEYDHFQQNIAHLVEYCTLLVEYDHFQQNIAHSVDYCTLLVENDHFQQNIAHSVDYCTLLVENGTLLVKLQLHTFDVILHLLFFYYRILHFFVNKKQTEQNQSI